MPVFIELHCKLVVEPTVPFYVSPVPASCNDVNTLVSASRNMTNLMLVNSVTTHDDDLFQVAPYGYRNLQLKLSPDYTNHVVDFDITVVMPHDWTPKIYLALLHHLIQRNGLITLETIELNGAQWKSLNDMHHLF